MEAAFKVAEQDGDGLDPGLFGEILQPFFPNLIDRDAVLPLLLNRKVHHFQLCVREL